MSAGFAIARSLATWIGDAATLTIAALIRGHLIFRAGQVEAVVVPLEECRALKALEQREAELYWVAHESRYLSRPGDDVPDGKVYDSMEALVAGLGAGG